jgi:hypothetical protein
MDAKTFESIMAEGRLLKRELDAVVISAEPPQTWEEIEAMCAQRRQLLALRARLDLLEAELADDASDAMRTLRVGAEIAMAKAKQAKARRP